MRAAQTTLRRPALLLPRRAERPRRECAGTAHSGAVWLFGTMFLAGYLPGIWLGRGGVSALGQQLAAYYTKRSRKCSVRSNFRDRIFGELFTADRSIFVRLLCVGRGLVGAAVCGARRVPGLLRGLGGSGERCGGAGAVPISNNRFRRGSAVFVPVAGGLVGTPGRGTV